MQWTSWNFEYDGPLGNLNTIDPLGNENMEWTSSDFVYAKTLTMNMVLYKYVI